ncbi:cell division initiation protein [Streptomyces qinzhouensis]|uniref:Cell division initiation protein n=1 Tax=Streptomyces qinzhouensis TaxID=2599401 RepID=A0A5B8IL15_9ACTN|nr:cell division initiation protein [Streptomyces qinzhouensis]QDY79222.1 cell division initiation protein [Streptomyces qinzhouensis]
MDVQKKLDEITAVVTGARALPMSASCVVNRAELLALLDEARAALPGSLGRARELIGERERTVALAHEEARSIVRDAHAERGALLSGSRVALDSRAEADRILGEAHRAAEEIRAEADDYVDAKLANFEVVLVRTIGSVGRGRERLAGRAPDEPWHGAAPAPGGAGAYADATLGAFEEVLTRTLDAVGRGRITLQGRTADGVPGERLPFPDPADPGPERATSDAEYLAGLAEPAGAAAGFAAPEPTGQMYGDGAGAGDATGAPPVIPAQPDPYEPRDRLRPEETYKIHEMGEPYGPGGR